MNEKWKPQRAPSGMGEKALKLWHAVADNYILRPDEYRVLEDACRQTAIVDALERELVGADLVMRGSMGQPVANPLLSEIRQHRNVIASLLRQLGLPNEPAGEVTEISRSVQARDAAKSRWTVAHGKAG